MQRIFLVRNKNKIKISNKNHDQRRSSMNKRKHLLQIIILVLALTIFTPGCKKGEQSTTKAIKIGAILPLTGFLSNLGEDEKIGIELALEEINKNQKKIEIIYEDSMSSPKNSIPAANKLVASGVKKIILSTTPTVLSVLQAYKNNKNLFFVAQCMAPNVLKEYSNAIRIYATVDKETSLMAEYIKSNDSKKIFLLHINNDFGKSAIAELKQKISSQNIEMKQETFGFFEKNYTPLILKMKEFQPDIVVIYSYPNQWPNIIKQMEESDFNLPIIANSGFGFIVKNHKDLNIIKNIIYTAPYYVFSKDDENIKKFKIKLKKKYNKEPNFDIVYFYDMMKILSSNIIYGEPIAVLKDKITSKKYNSISGKIEFKNDDIVADMKLVKFIDGQIIEVTK